MRRLIILCLAAACGGKATTTPPDNRTPGTGDRGGESGNDLDGGPVAQAWDDAGPAPDPVVTPDAGLMELGAAQCEMVIARLIACPQVGAEFKDELEKKQAEIRQMAVDPRKRAEVAGMCRQLVEAMEETLRRLSC